MNGRWAEAGSWVERLAPIAGDTLSISGRVSLTDADAAAAGLATDIVVCADSTLVVSNDAAVALGARVYGGGSLVKLGTGELAFTRGAAKGNDFCLSRGLVVSNGVVRYAPVAVTTGYWGMNLGPLSVWAPGELVVPDGPNLILHIAGISGDGVISNPNGTSDVQLRFGGTGVWAGMLKGDHLRVYAPGDITYTCPTSTISYSEFSTSEGRASFYSFGMRGAPSSSGYASTILGRDNGGTIRYLGPGGETTDKVFSFSRTTTAQSGVFDAGPNGGVTLAGRIVASVQNRWSLLTLTGSNTAPMVIADGYEEWSTGPGYIVKDGSGTWYFKETTAVRQQKGVYELREGTLRFDSIANTGAACSLGPQTRLVAATNAIGNITASADYSFLLGTKAGCEPVLEYTGVGKGETDRLIAVAGTARLRNTSATTPLAWNGGAVPYGTATRRTLILEGCDTVTNRIENLRDRDGKTFDLVIDGGAWELGTNNTFSGTVTVRRGKLLAVPHHRHFTWFKWIIRESGGGRKVRTGGTCSDNNVGARELEFFDAAGNNVSRGAFTQRTVASVTSLQPGEMAYANAYVPKTVYNDRLPANLFNGGVTDQYLVYPKTFPVRLDQTATWFALVFRFPESVGDIAGYDVFAYGSGEDRSICDWQMLGSEDGQHWIPLDERAPANTYSRWVSGNLTNGATTSRNLATDKYFPLTYVEDTTGYGLPSARVVVEPGAEYVGRTDVGTKIPSVISVSDGLVQGVYTGFEVPSTGTLDISCGFDWYRWTAMETFNGYRVRTQPGFTGNDANVSFQELAIYSDLGTRINLGLQMGTAGRPEALEPGYVCYPWTGVIDYSPPRSPNYLFDDLNTGNGFCATRNNGIPRLDNANTWMTIVFRLAEGAGVRARSYDLMSPNGGDYMRNPRVWKLETSPDGKTWTTVHEGTNASTAANCWYSDGAAYTAGTVRQGYPMDFSSASAKVNLRDFTCSADFSGCTGTANFRNWTVSVNGTPVPDVHLVYKNGQFSVLVPSFLMILR